jgi:hypothetical protein
MSTMSRTVGHDIDITQTDQKSVDEFVERLAAFSVDQWLSVAATHDARLCAAATATLEQVVAHHELRVDMWSIAEDVETAFHYGIGAGRLPPTRRDCESLRLAREIAGAAALALFARALLNTADFEMLYRPFAVLVPLSVGHSPQSIRGRAPLGLVSSSSRCRFVHR